MLKKKAEVDQLQAVAPKVDPKLEQQIAEKSVSVEMAWQQRIGAGRTGRAHAPRVTAAHGSETRGSSRSQAFLRSFWVSLV